MQNSIFRENNIGVDLPKNSIRKFTLFKRLFCAGVDYEFSSRNMDMDHFEEDTLFPRFKQYYMNFWRTGDEYPVRDSPFGIMRFKWLNVFKFFPHPLFYRKPESAISDNATIENRKQTS